MFDELFSNIEMWDLRC